MHLWMKEATTMYAPKISPPGGMTPAEIVKTLQHYRFSCATEDELQRGIAKVLGDDPWKREVRLTPMDRPDFFSELEGIEGLQIDPEHVKKLAEAYLLRKRH
jgi:hypothetical protein